MFSSDIIFKSATINLSAQICIYIISFVSIPILITYLGKESYGIFQTLLTALAWVSIANLGLGNGLRNKITQLYHNNSSTQDLKLIIGSAFSYSTLISIFLIIVFGLGFYYLFDPSILVKDLNVSKDDVKLTFVITFIFFSLNLTLSLISSIAFAIHKSYLNTFSQFLQLSFFLLLIYISANHIESRQIVWASFFYGITSLICQLVPLVFFYNDKKIWKPIFTFNFNYIKKLSSISFQFFLLQISTIILFSSDNFIISKFLGAEQVGEYSISYKLYFLVITVFTIILVQLWSSTTKAMTDENYEWIRINVKKLHYLLLPICVVLILLSVSYRYITYLWLGDNFVMESDGTYFKVLFSIYVLLHCSNAIFSNVLNGLGRLKYQTVAYLLGFMLYTICSYYFIVTAELGLVGLMISKVISILITLLICLFDYKKFIKNRI